MIETAPGTVTVFADIGCVWAHLALYRLHQARSRHGLENDVSFDIRAFPLDLFNGRPTPRIFYDTEIAALGPLDPDAGWSIWVGDPAHYPVSLLLAMEAVEAAKDQGLGLSDRFDLALRRAFIRDGRCISLHTEIVAVAGDVPGLDAGAIERSLIEGRCRPKVFEDFEEAKRSEVQGSPHLFLPDGSDIVNPGIENRWHGKKGGFPIIDKDDPGIYDDLIHRAAP